MLSSRAHKLDDVERTQDVFVSENINFEGLLLSEPTLTGLLACGFEKPSPIQLKAIPFGRCGFDLIAQAKSGTGKTCVFGVIALEMLQLPSKSLQVLILAPTREIAFQVADVVTSIGQGHEGLQVATFIGGLPVEEDRRKARSCHVAVGSPGRVKQLIDEGVLVTSHVRLVVLDEADKLLEPTFLADINHIFSVLPDNKQTLAASATYTEELKAFLEQYMRNPLRISPDTLQREGGSAVLLGVRQCAGLVPMHPNQLTRFRRKLDALVSILSAIEFKQCIVFNNMHGQAEAMSQLLNGKGFPTEFISGHMDQPRRLKAIAALVDFKCRVLLSTDLSARGLDAANVNLVVNMDIPQFESTYLHRVGRSGRFGTQGLVVTICEDAGKELERLRNISTKIQVEMECFNLKPGETLPPLWTCPTLPSLQEFKPKKSKIKKNSTVEPESKTSTETEKLEDKIMEEVEGNVTAENEEKGIELNIKEPQINIQENGEEIFTVNAAGDNILKIDVEVSNNLESLKQNELKTSEIITAAGDNVPEIVTEILNKSEPVQQNELKTVEIINEENGEHELDPETKALMKTEALIKTMKMMSSPSSSKEKKDLTTNKPTKPPRKQKSTNCNGEKSSELSPEEDADNSLDLNGSLYGNILNTSDIDKNPFGELFKGSPCKQNEPSPTLNTKKLVKDVKSKSPKINYPFDKLMALVDNKNSEKMPEIPESERVYPKNHKNKIDEYYENLKHENNESEEKENKTVPMESKVTEFQSPFVQLPKYKCESLDHDYSHEYETTPSKISVPEKSETSPQPEAETKQPETQPERPYFQIPRSLFPVQHTNYNRQNKYDSSNQQYYNNNRYGDYNKHPTSEYHNRFQPSDYNNCYASGGNPYTSTSRSYEGSYDGPREFSHSRGRPYRGGGHSRPISDHSRFTEASPRPRGGFNKFRGTGERPPFRVLNMSNALAKLFYEVKSYTIPENDEVIGYDNLEKLSQWFVPSPAQVGIIESQIPQFNYSFLLSGMHKMNGDAVIQTKRKFVKYGGTVNYLNMLADGYEPEEDENYQNRVCNSFRGQGRGREEDHDLMPPVPFELPRWIERSEWTLGYKIAEDGTKIEATLSSGDEKKLLKLNPGNIKKLSSFYDFENTSSEDEFEEPVKPKRTGAIKKKIQVIKKGNDENSKSDSSIVPSSSSSEKDPAEQSLSFPEESPVGVQRSSRLQYDVAPTVTSSVAAEYHGSSGSLSSSKEMPEFDADEQETEQAEEDKSQPECVNIGHVEDSGESDKNQYEFPQFPGKPLDDQTKEKKPKVQIPFMFPTDPVEPQFGGGAKKKGPSAKSSPFSPDSSQSLGGEARKKEPKVQSPYVFPPFPTDPSESLDLWKQQVKLTTFMIHYAKYMESMYHSK